MHKPRPKAQRGFTLLELTLVLLIITLALTATLSPLRTMLEGKRRMQAATELERIREAMLGFAMINGYLPCPGTTANPAADDYGLEDASCDTDATAEGYLPWRTLGVKAVDPWGLIRSAEADPFNGYWRYRVDRNFSDSTTPFTLQTTQEDNIMIVDNDNNLLTSATERPVAVIYSTGANRGQDGHNGTYEAAVCGNTGGYNRGTGTACPNGNPLYQGGDLVGVGAEAAYDDILIWISRPLLFNRMVTAGRLP